MESTKLKKKLLANCISFYISMISLARNVLHDYSSCEVCQSDLFQLYIEGGQPKEGHVTLSAGSVSPSKAVDFLV